MTGLREPRATVVVPTRDRWPLLRMTLRSILAQDERVSVVVVDDGSTDGTARHARALDDVRVVVRTNPRSRGVAAARNTGLGLVETPWVAFVDDDDVWAPNHLSRLLREIDSAPLPPAVAYSGNLVLEGGRVVASKPPPPPEGLLPRMLERNELGPPSGVLVRTEVVREARGFDERLSVLADWDMWLKALDSAPAVCSPALSVGYRRHGSNMHLDVKRTLGDLRLMTPRYRPMAARYGVSFPGHDFPGWIARCHRAAGRPFRAAVWYARSAAARREWRDLVRAAVAPLGLRATARLQRRATGEPVDPAAGRWLEHLMSDRGPEPENDPEPVAPAGGPGVLPRP